ncbi:uncharacterized 104.1 kDa protein in hypE 3'region-like isoform X3 [Etheostoma cragini]|uniref:uncharacterized 104.1 kDa protein in hypE 3'region-like isoform X3 n=1 Tax=Etheostoma cragini TaxID=417921 RepID=UPI00155E01ED|nr:uncharacterized 104.1 kDa protein in hypE 3'region-like isoform X3 [Etheostoma cragini]
MIRTPQDDIEEMEEEAAANYVNAPARTGKKMAARPGQRFRCFSQSFLPIAVCWLILLVIMGLRIYYLTALNQELESRNQELESRNQELESRNQELETQNQELETQNQELETRNQELETEMKNLKGPIPDMSRAQWSIDEYCPKVKKGMLRSQ